MKLKLEVDLTPQELRALFGLPDVAGIQDDLIQYIRERMAAGVDVAEAVQMLRNFWPEQLVPQRAQRVFSRIMSKVARADTKTSFKVKIDEEDLEGVFDDDEDVDTGSSKSKKR